MLPDRYLAELLVTIAAGEPLTRGELRDLALEVMRLRRALRGRAEDRTEPEQPDPAERTFGRGRGAR